MSYRDVPVRAVARIAIPIMDPLQDRSKTKNEKEKGKMEKKSSFQLFVGWGV